MEKTSFGLRKWKVLVSTPRGISHYHAGGHQRHVFKRRIQERHPLDLR